MSDELSIKLRFRADWPGADAAVHALMVKAADELDRLRAELAAPREQKPAATRIAFAPHNALNSEIVYHQFVPVGANLYASPVPSQSEQDARDAERYRWLRCRDNSLEAHQRDKNVYNGPSCYHEVGGIRELKYGEALDTAIDAAILAAQQQKVKP